MPQPHAEPTCYGLTTARLEALSDGVLAIVITLLVLSFANAGQGIAASPNMSSREIVAYLFGLWPHLLGYALSFVLIAVYCLLHHWMFHYIRRADQGLVWLNVLFLMSVSFLPFPTDLLAECILHESNAIVIFYGLSHAVAGLSLAMMWVYAIGNRRLIAPDVEDETIRAVLRTTLAAPALYAAGAALSFASIPASIALYALIPLLYIAPQRLGGRTIGAARVRGAGLAPHTTQPTGTLLHESEAAAVNRL
jgi:uncharacterized membrane protein